LCEARCCYDGVYLIEGEEEKINGVVRENPQFFRHLPKEYIVDGSRGETKGRKTSIKAHEYQSPDFPQHFTKTRCVFGESDGACSLQTASKVLTENDWTFKPKACRLHPLKTMNIEYFAPSTSIENDKYNIGVNYPGYVSYTACGVNRLDGVLWTIALQRDIEDFESNIK
jgi:Fe-S-cluster containining protein